VIPALLAGALATYAALVPCLRSSSRVAVSAASSFFDQSWSILASPHLIGRQVEAAKRRSEGLTA